MTNNSTKLPGEQQPVFAGGRVIGEVKNAVFSKQIKGSKHILRKPRAIALDVDSLRQAKEYGAAFIRITDTENGAVYSCDIAHFDRYSFELNRGFGFQRALPLEYWGMTGAAKVSPANSERPNTANNGAVQMSLFEAV